ncbi:uncharacterized protein LOC120335740 isoform X3 [Styela clava]
MGKPRKRTTAKEAQKSKMEESDGARREETARKQTNNGLIVILILMIVLTWGIAATAYFGVIDYKGLVVRGSRIKVTDAAGYASALYPFQYDSARHPLKAIGKFLTSIDDYITNFLFSSEVSTNSLKKHRPIVRTIPLNKESNIVKRDTSKSESVVSDDPNPTKKPAEEKDVAKASDPSNDKDKPRKAKSPQPKQPKDSSTKKTKQETVKTNDVAITLNIQLYVGDQPAFTERHLIADNGTTLRIERVMNENEQKNSKNKCISKPEKAFFLSNLPINKAKTQFSGANHEKSQIKNLKKVKRSEEKITPVKENSKSGKDSNSAKKSNSPSKLDTKVNKNPNNNKEDGSSVRKHQAPHSPLSARKTLRSITDGYITNNGGKNVAARLKFLRKHIMKIDFPRDEAKNNKMEKFARLTFFSKFNALEKIIAEEKSKIRILSQKIALTTPIPKHSANNQKNDEVKTFKTNTKIVLQPPNSKGNSGKRMNKQNKFEVNKIKSEEKILTPVPMDKASTINRGDSTEKISKDEGRGKLSSKITILKVHDKEGFKRLKTNNEFQTNSQTGRKNIISAPLNKPTKRVIVFGKLNRVILRIAPINKQKEFVYKREEQRSSNKNLSDGEKSESKNRKLVEEKIVRNVDKIPVEKDSLLKSSHENVVRKTRETFVHEKIVVNSQFNKLTTKSSRVSDVETVSRNDKVSKVKSTRKDRAVGAKVAKHNKVIKTAPVWKLSKHVRDVKQVRRDSGTRKQIAKHNKGIKTAPLSKVFRDSRDIHMKSPTPSTAIVSHKSPMNKKEVEFDSKRKIISDDEEPRTPKAKLKKKLSRMFDRTFDLISFVGSFFQRFKITDDFYENLPESVKKFITKAKNTKIGSKILDVTVNTTLFDAYQFAKRNGLKTFRICKEKWNNFYEFIQKKPSYKAFMNNMSKFSIKMQKKFDKLSTLIEKHFLKLQDNQKLLTSVLITLSVIGLYSILRSCFHAVLRPRR